ncbi:hypothetical protein KSP40_PGU021972 [Platanthera guangdongensis]|uniref:Uncharacterized protein n=1 Tax=Platanthera guangdongensis TaxID=2320717 RepID=A0ABR2N4Z3_9ASPA
MDGSAAVAERGNSNGEKETFSSPEQLLRHPLALLALVPNGVALFSAGALAGTSAKSLIAPLDRIKLLMRVIVLPFLLLIFSLQNSSPIPLILFRFHLSF